MSTVELTGGVPEHTAPVIRGGSGVSPSDELHNLRSTVDNLSSFVKVTETIRQRKDKADGKKGKKGKKSRSQAKDKSKDKSKDKAKGNRKDQKKKRKKSKGNDLGRKC